jgi:asparagine synthase (glutamine-hydrolysing)
VKVALSGDGGDELFGGYHDYAWAYQTDEYLARRRWMGPLRPVAALGSKVLHRLGLSDVNHGHHEAYAALPGHLRLFREMGFKPGCWQIHGAAFQDGRGFAQAHLSKTWEANKSASLAQTLARASLETRLLNDYLVKVDRTSMMSSVEVRSPFLDRALAEFAARLPGRLKFGNGKPKNLLRGIARRHVDPNALDRPKSGFGIPVGEWLRGELRGFSEDVVLGRALRESGLVQMATAERILREHQEQRADHADRLWCLLVLGLWLGRYRP